MTMTFSCCVPGMIASELFQFTKGSPDRGKIWKSIQERLNKLDNTKFVIKDKRGVRDRWNLLQVKFKSTQREELQGSGIDCELSEKDALIEELCDKEDSFSPKGKKKSDDKEAAEEIRKKAMERMASKMAAPKRAEEAGVMRLNSSKKKLKASIPFANKS